LPSCPQECLKVPAPTEAELCQRHKDFLSNHNPASEPSCCASPNPAPGLLNNLLQAVLKGKSSFEKILDAEKNNVRNLLLLISALTI